MTGAAASSRRSRRGFHPLSGIIPSKAEALDRISGNTHVPWIPRGHGAGMALDFSAFFQRYQALAAEADKAFTAIHQASPGAVRCERGCSDCCHALFDLTLIEALYLNHHFNRAHEGLRRSAILERADAADRQVHKLKKKAFKASQEGKPASEIFSLVARERIRCPLLNDEDLCDLYAHRPITCRLYGVPLAIGGKAHTCGLSGFEPGKPYRTVMLDRIQGRLMELSRELVQSLDTAQERMWDMLVPPSMALMTEYNENYLGIRKKPKAKPATKAGQATCVETDCAACPSAKTGCSPTTLTIGRAPEKPSRKKAAPKSGAKAEKKAAPQKAKDTKSTGKDLAQKPTAGKKPARSAKK